MCQKKNTGGTLSSLSVGSNVTARGAHTVEGP